MTRSADAASISVVVPTYNDVGRLGDALGAVVEQTLLPQEIVVSDDCSEDGTEAFVREFAAQHEHRVPVRYTRTRERSRDLGARNAGVAVASGEWIANCDSDDVWLPQKLERQMEFIRSWQGNRPLALLGAYGYNTNDAKQVLSVARMGPTSEEECEELRRTGGLFFVIHSTALYRRADYEAIGGYTSEYGAANEWDFFSRMAERGVVVNVAEPLVYYRKRGGSMQLDLFWEQREGLWHLEENRRRRVRGEPTIDRKQFAAQLAGAPARRRLRRRMRVRGMYYYRRGTTDMVNGRPLRAGWELALAGLLDPGRVRAGILGTVRHRLSPRR